MPISKIEDAIKDFKKGKMVILVDDADRENEGDLIVASEFATPNVINFMATHGRGLICVTMDTEVADRLDLSPVKNNFDKIDTKIVYATIVELSNNKLEKKEMEKIVLIDVPSKIYHELRNIFVYLFENSGFKDVKISERVDFEKLYQMRKIQ